MYYMVLFQTLYSLDALPVQAPVSEKERNLQLSILVPRFIHTLLNTIFFGVLLPHVADRRAQVPIIGTRYL